MSWITLGRTTVALLAALAIATAAAQGTWTATSWTDPLSGAELAAIATPGTFGADGRAIVTCTADGTTVFALEAAAWAGLDGEQVTMAYRMDTDPEATSWGEWIRAGDGSVVRYAGETGPLEEMLAELAEAVSPAFFFRLETTAADDVAGLMVLESQGFAQARASLPCGAGD